MIRALTLEGMQQAGVHLPVLRVGGPEQAQGVLRVAWGRKGGEAQPVGIGHQLLSLCGRVGPKLAEAGHVGQGVAGQRGLQVCCQSLKQRL